MRRNNALYIDTCLPFGLRSAPKLFNLLADLLAWTLEQKVQSHYITWMTSFSWDNQCERNLEEVRAMCEQLGIPLAIEKVAGPMTTLPFLAITLDTIKMEAHLLVEKLDRMREIVAFWLPKKSATKQATYIKHFNMPPRLFELEGPSYEKCTPQLPKCSNCIIILDLGGTFT